MLKTWNALCFDSNKSLNEEVSLKLHLWTFWSVFTERNDRFADVFIHFNSSLFLSYMFQFRSETLSPQQRPMRRSVFLETTITDVVNYQKLLQISQLLQIYLDLCRLCKPAIGDVHVYSYPWRKYKIRVAWDFYWLVNKLCNVYHTFQCLKRNLRCSVKKEKKRKTTRARNIFRILIVLF